MKKQWTTEHRILIERRLEWTTEYIDKILTYAKELKLKYMSKWFYPLLTVWSKNSILKSKEYSLDKEQTSYDDLLDALRLSLKGYNIMWKHFES
jgi:hypothetical protein